MFKSHEIKFMALIFYVAFAAEGKAPPPPSRFLDGGDVAERATALILHTATIAFGDRGGALLVDQDIVQIPIGVRFKSCLAKLLLPHPVFWMGEMSPNASRH